MSKIVFLGTGGGRFVTAHQTRATGGIYMELDKVRFMIDPGPGCIVHAKQYGVNLGRVNVLILSHNHMDHTSDAAVVMESMSRAATKKLGTLIGAVSTIEETDDYPTVSKYHQGLMEHVVKMGPNEKTETNGIKITSTKTNHSEPHCIGFIFEGSKRISYVSDTEYFPELHEPHMGADILILNVLRPYNEEWPKHMNTQNAIKLIEEIKPKVTIFQHFGLKVTDPDKEAKIAADKTGRKVIAAKDGMTLDLDDLLRTSLKDFAKV
jgi:ribonuclease BN (tRNA processing enzyme)